MKKIIIFVLSLFVFLNPSIVSAHLVGQPPFFKINGVYTNLYPVPTSSATDFNLPQDLADRSFAVGDKLQMEMDVNQLPILPEVIDNTKFLWDFGDGGKGEGLKNSHAYSKPGSYVLTINAKYQTDDPQLIQSVLINVLPDKNYQLPKAVLVVNGQESKDPLTDILKFDLKKEVQFDSSKSTTKGKIVEYFWDFGDGTSSKEANPKHTYSVDVAQIFPVLRIKDDQGFISDAYVEVDTGQDSGGAASASLGGNSFVSWPMIGIGVIVLLAVGGIWFAKSKIKK